MSEALPEISSGLEASWPEEVCIHTDGASRGNPGPSSLGVLVLDIDGGTVCEYALALGEQTNNVAEYSAVKKALELASDKGVRRLVLKSDSELLIRQLAGVYKVKSEKLRPLFQDCKRISQRFEQLEFEHVRREMNSRADELANRVLDMDFS